MLATGLAGWGYGGGTLTTPAPARAVCRVHERSWLAEEDAYLRAHGHTTCYQEMCQALGVSMADLKRRLRKLGISLRRGRPRLDWQRPGE